MKKLRMYQCEICGTNYTDKLKAIECEKYHATGLEIIDCQYHGINVCGKFPTRIWVKSKGGEKRMYTL